jgi:ribonucleoside-diphosphate reductase alpha chain
MSHTTPTAIHEGPPASNLRQELLRQRYLRKDAHGNVLETPEQMFSRTARFVAVVELKYGASESEVKEVADSFYRLMNEGLFLPNSPTLMNAGKPNGLLSACFVLSIDDSVDGILGTLHKAMLIQAAGGGVGFAFDKLRPEGDAVGTSRGVASGPIAFWRIYSEATKAIQQGALRRGANMGMMAADHPDILKFISAKADGVSFSNFNITVKVTDAFMRALAGNPSAAHIVVNPRDGARYKLPAKLDHAKYSLQDLVPADDTRTHCLTVGDIWNIIVKAAHATGEPGICFIDRVNRDNPTPLVGIIIILNACGEQPLLPGEACNLGSVNLAKFVVPERHDLDWDKLKATVRTAIRFLDDVVEASCYPIQEAREMSLGNRKVGLGMMGLADTLALLGIRYDSDQAVDFARKVSAFVQTSAHEASEELAKARGVFPNWTGSTWDTRHHRPMRNATCTTIAPTGSLSILAECSSGIEPIYLLAYQRRALDGQRFNEVHPLVRILGTQEGWLTEDAIASLLAGKSLRDIPGVPERLAETVVTAHEVAPEWHVKMQAAVQENVDNAVSKTVNLPAGATVRDVERIYRMAFESGCKGLTVYRDGARTEQVISGTGEGQVSGPADGPRPRPRLTRGTTTKTRTGCGTLFVTVNRDRHGWCEVFANLGKAGGCPSQSEATCRAISAAFRSGVDPKVMVEQLRGIRCLSTCVARKRNGSGIDVLSCPDAIAKAIEASIDGLPSRILAAGHERACPDCGAPLRKEHGCWVCLCGFSWCG